MLRSLGLVLLLLLGGTNSWAQEIRVIGESLRQLGMGGVYVYSENDPGALYQNPAYLCRTEGINIDIAELQSGINGLTIYNDIQDIGEIDGLDSIEQFYGKPIWLGLDARSSLVLPCLGFGGYISAGTQLFLQNPLMPKLDVSLNNEKAYIAGFAFNAFPETHIGMNIKQVFREGGSASFSGATLQDIDAGTILDALQASGTAYALDFGITKRWGSSPLNPTVSLMLRDAGVTTFTLDDLNNPVERQEDNLTLGFTFDGQIPLAGVAGGIEYRHINRNDIPIGKKIHLGAELQLFNFDLRAGFYQGYTSYGLGMSLGFADLDLTSYSIESGAFTGQTADQRVQLGISFQLGFNPDLSLSDSKGKKRKLKQRR